MPELPEAETIVRGLRRSVVGETIDRVQVIRPDVLRQSRRAVGAALRERRIERVGRRGKNVLLHLDDQGVLAVNLGMTGRLLPYRSLPRVKERPGHPAVVLHFRSDAVLFFDDTRRFGTVEALDAQEWAEREARMGPEPLEKGFSTARFRRDLGGSRAPIRSWLLDQRRIAGVGNIYAAEALYLAGIHPKRPANRIEAHEAEALRRTLRSVLRAAIRQGGTTIRDYRNADGGQGAYAQRLHVYGRDGDDCDRCGSRIERVVFANRSAFFCTGCQPDA